MVEVEFDLSRAWRTYWLLFRDRETKMNDNGVFGTLIVREVFCVHEKKKQGNSTMVSGGLHIQVKTVKKSKLKSYDKKK